MIKKIKPILRYPGSKYKKIDKIISILNIKENDNFLDMFGGSGIVGANVKQLTNAKTTINDFDNMFPVTNHKAIKNIISFQGMGKNFTKQAVDLFIKRINNGYWDKLKEYNSILKRCKITNENWLLMGQEKKLNDYNKIYVDPPYHGVYNLYTGNFNTDDHIYLKVFLENNFSKNKKILVSYNDTAFIRYLYKNWYIYDEEYQYQTGQLNRTYKKKKTNELFITNFKLNLQE